MSTRYIRRSSEDTEQIAVMQWARMSSGRWPALSLLHHIPNGGSRNTKEAARLKSMGVLAGVPDLHLPVAKAGYNGLYIEMKYGDGRLQESQKSFLVKVAEQNYYCAVCYSAEDAIMVLEDYMHDITIYPNLSIIKGKKRTKGIQ